MKKSILVVGLGLIGGSLAIGLDGFEDYEIIGCDVSQPTLRFAAEHGICHRLTERPGDVLPQVDMTLLCLHPQGILDFMAEHAGQFRPGSLVTDVCGIKTAIMEGASVLPEGVDFIGGHPMAGTEFSGIEHAFGAMFQGAHYLITPRETSTPEHIDLLRRMAEHIGFRDFISTTTAQHDAMIAYTSQMMHIIALSVCDDEGLFTCKGFEGNSFRDCTRVAALDVPLWTQLFSLNAPALDAVLDKLERNLAAYRKVLQSGDRQALADKLAFSAARKRQMNLE